MGLFDFFWKKKVPATPPPAENKQPNDLLQSQEVVPGIVLPKALAAHWPQIERSRMEFISIDAKPAKQAKFTESGFGYKPCLPVGFSYPTDKDGKSMYPLAQVNCNQLPPLSGYPTSGFLQFYISLNDMLGLDLDNQLSQAYSRVLYFSNEDVQDHQVDLSFIDDILKSEESPVHQPHAITFNIKHEYAPAGEINTLAGGRFDYNPILDLYPSIAEELEDAYYEAFFAGGNKLGGYAYFTQSDPRENNNDLKDYILLLQIDSSDDIMWGDLGVANFFIHPNDLARKDFSKVLYNWDCS